MKSNSFVPLLFAFTTIFLTTSCGIKKVSEHQQPNVDPVKNETPATPVRKEVSENWDKTTAEKFLIISELKRKLPTEGIYETEGYIVDSVPMCDCPPKVICRCDPSSVTISEQNQVPGSSELSKIELRILNEPDGLIVRRKYRFKIKSTGYYSIQEPHKEVFYVAHKLLE